MKGHSGFTLIELIVVLVIIGILAMGLTMEWPGNKIQVASQSQRLATDLRYAQNLAQVRHQRIRINFSASQYTMTALNGTTAIVFPASNTNITHIPNTMTLSETSLPNHYIVFDEVGIPYTDNAVPGAKLGTAATVILSGDGRTATVTIHPNTGMVSNPVIVG